MNDQPDYDAILNHALPQTNGRLSLPGLHEPVEILRDSWRVPPLPDPALTITHYLLFIIIDQLSRMTCPK